MFITMGTTANSRFKKVREELNLTQKNVAALFKVDATTPGKWEKEGASIPSDHFETFCEAFNVSKDWLFAARGKPYLSSIEDSQKRASDMIKEFKGNSNNPWTDEAYRAKDKLISRLERENENLQEQLNRVWGLVKPNFLKVTKGAAVKEYHLPGKGFNAALVANS